MTAALTGLSGLSGLLGHGDDPYAIPDLAADFDADDLLATLSDTDPVTTWVDATGNANDVGNTGSNRPTFDAANPHFAGRASVNFAKASSQYLFSVSAPIVSTMSGDDKPLTAFVVARRPTKVTADEAAFSFGDSSAASPYLWAQWRYASSNSQRWRIAASDGSESSAQGLVGTTDRGPQVLVASLSGTSMSGYVVGATQNPRYDATVPENTTDYSARGSMTFDQFGIGALLRSSISAYLEGEVARVLVYTRELTEAERLRVASYLWFRYCDIPVSSTLSAPLLPDLTHLWSTDSLTGDAGTKASSLTDQIGGKNFGTGLSATRPTIRIHDNGHRYLEFDGVDDVMTAGVAADWTFLHDGSDFSAYLVYRPKSAATALTPMLDTLDNDPVNENGIGIYHDAASAAHSLQFKIGATHATLTVLDHDSQDYGARPDAWHVAHITCEADHPSSEEDYQLGVDNENYAAVDEGTAPNAAASSNVLTLGALAGLGTYGQFDFAALLVYDVKHGRPGQVQATCESLASFWNTPHVSLVAGNGLANVLNDTNKHRGFPAICQDAVGIWHCIYRRADDHGSSRGVGIHVTSADGIRWSSERVIYDVDDDDGRDFRGGGSFIRLTQGDDAGRLIYVTNWAADDSSLEVAGFGSTNLLGYSDDNGATWTWINPQENDPKNDYANPWDYTVANAAALIELSTGRILMTFASKDDGQNTDNQDLNLSYSDDGGLTWSDSAIVYTHDGALGTDKRITESHIVEWDDGDLTMLVRNDTDKEIWRATANISDVEDWTFEVAKEFDGWGRPMAIRDPNDTAGLYIFYRSDPGDVTVWRYSDDEGVTWSDERAFSNLHSTTNIDAYAEMSYCFATLDADGNVWVASGLEDGDDSDIFVRRWVDAA